MGTGLAEAVETDIRGAPVAGPASTAMPVDGASRRVSLPRREFLADVVVALRARLSGVSRIRHRASMNLVKVFYGNERVHYDEWETQSVVAHLARA